MALTGAESTTPTWPREPTQLPERGTRQFNDTQPENQRLTTYFNQRRKNHQGERTRSNQVKLTLM